MAHSNPGVLARDVVGADQVEEQYRYLHYRGIRGSREPPNPEPPICTFVIDLTGVAEFESRKSQPLPGTRKLWEPLALFTPALIMFRGMNAQKISN